VNTCVRVSYHKSLQSGSFGEDKIKNELLLVEELKDALNNSNEDIADMHYSDKRPNIILDMWLRQREQ